MAVDRPATMFEWVAQAAAARHETVSNTALCQVACVPLNVDGASVTLMATAGADEPPPRMRQEPRAATDARSLRVEELQLTTGEGPSLTAFTHQQPVLAPDLAATKRWPGFTLAAGEQHVSAVFAFPLLTADSCLGVFTAHRAQTGTLSPQQLVDAHHLAALAYSPC